MPHNHPIHPNHTENPPTRFPNYNLDHYGRGMLRRTSTEPGVDEDEGEFDIEPTVANCLREAVYTLSAINGPDSDTTICILGFDV